MKYQIERTHSVAKARRCKREIEIPIIRRAYESSKDRASPTGGKSGLQGLKADCEAPSTHEDRVGKNPEGLSRSFQLFETL